jgi:anti-sigma factor RsiW
MNEHIPTDQLIDYLHQELSPAEDALVLSHLTGCAACAGELERESALTDALRAAALRDERDLPPMLKAHVWDAIRREPAPSIWPAWLRPALAFPAAAIVAAGAMLSLGALQNGAPRITANYYLAAHASGRANPLNETPSHPADPIDESDAQLPQAAFASLTEPFDAPDRLAER